MLIGANPATVVSSPQANTENGRRTSRRRAPPTEANTRTCPGNFVSADIAVNHKRLCARGTAYVS